MFSVGNLDALIDCSGGAFILNGGILLGQAIFPLQLKSGSNTLQFVLTIDKFNFQQPVGLCVQGGEVNAPTIIAPGLLFYLTRTESLLLSNGTSIGPRSTSIPAIRASITQLILQAGNIAGSSNEASVASTLPLNCPLNGDWESIGLVLGKFTAENRLPEVTLLQIKSAGIVTDVLEIEEEVELIAVAEDLDENDLKLEVIVYGVPPEGCSKTTCGDATFASASSGKAQVTAKIKFPLAGRYTVRARVSDGSGSVIWKDFAVYVYKKGEAARAAPCCRHTSYITAHNLGRPIDRTYFRSKGSESTALGNSFGWSSEYWNGADVEAERLFDYSILAPQMKPYPVETLACADVRIGGAGGPEVYGLLWATEDTLGHSKFLTIVPESFQSWATGAQDVECAKHWSYGSDNSTSNACIVGCTSKMVENHIQTTGMVDQYSQALVQLSYGVLHISPRVRVLPEVQVAKEPVMPWDSTFGYYDTPSKISVAAAGLDTRPWMVLTLAPMAQHKIPPHRAWSAGIASGSATITKCFASLYYSVHETGHRLGFKHGQLLKLPAAHAVPSDPLQSSDPATQIVPDEGYSQRLDIMSCCKSDYGLFHRFSTGWLQNSKRTTISQQELAQPSNKKLILWPFDRSESRGKHLALVVRRSDDEILLIGFRSMSHWQEQDSSDSGNTTPEDHRVNVRGLQVEYLRRNSITGAWSDRAILDFNVMHGDYPHALPLRPGEISQQTQFSLLKEGRSWFDSSSRLLLSFERIAECDSPPEVDVYNYNVARFYGNNGEWPGKEAFVQHDFAGYNELVCAHVSISTAAEPPIGKLEVNIELQEGVLDKKVGSVSSQSMTCIDSSSNNDGFSSAASAEKDKPLLPSGSQLLNIQLQWNAGVDQISSIVWKDRWNRTLQASYSERFAINSNNNTGANAIAVLSASLPLTAHILASDGRHIKIEVSTEKLSTTKNLLVVAKKRYYQLTEKSISDGPAIILGSLSTQCQDQTNLNSKRKQEKALMLWLIIIGSILAVLLLGGVLIWIFKTWQRWRRRKTLEKQQGKEEMARRTTTPAALAEAAKQQWSGSSNSSSSFISKK